MPHLVNTLHHQLASIMYQIVEANHCWDGVDSWFRDEKGLTESIYVQGSQDYNRADRFLPRGEAELPRFWLARLRNADWKPKYRQAIEKDFSSILTQFTLKDPHESILEYEDNFDGEGNSLTAIVKDYVMMALHQGMSGMFVDFPRENDATNIQEFRDLGLRPTVTIYKREDVLNWKFDKIAGRRVLTMIVLRDWVEVEDEDDEAQAATKLEERFKRLFLVRDPLATDLETAEFRQAYQLFKIDHDDDGKEIEILEEEGLTAAPYLTFVPLAMTTRPFYADLPLLHLARLNIQLYRKEANRDYYLDKCASPTLNVNDLQTSPPGRKDPVKIVIGPNTVLRNVEAKWLELTGASMTEIKTDIEDLLTQMDNEALAFLSGAFDKTATQSMIDTFQTQANLLGMASFLESALQTVFQYYAAYATGDFNLEDAGTADLSQAIDMIKLAATGEMAEVFQAIAEGTITRQLGLRLLKLRGFFGRSFTEADLEEELRKQGFSEETLDGFLTAQQLTAILGLATEGAIDQFELRAMLKLQTTRLSAAVEAEAERMRTEAADRPLAVNLNSQLNGATQETVLG